jgi:putative ABC transport system permease protein
MLKYDLNLPNEVEVVAIYDIANNTELHPFGGFRCIGNEYIDNGGWSITAYYYRTNGKIDEAVAKDVACRIIKEMVEMDGQTPKDSLDLVVAEVFSQINPKFIPLDKIHLGAEINGFHEPANPKVVYTLLILAIVIILIAYINYVNFFFARVPQRIKSINTRKILGSSRANLVMILVGESLTFTLISMVLAYVLVHALAPTLVGDAVDMDTVVYPNHKILIISILLPLLTAIAVSIYPALHITSIPPALALKGNITESHDSLLRYILIGFQITASTVLIIVSLFIHRNIDYINSTDLGFNRKNLLSVQTDQKISERRDEVRSLLLQNPDIIDITWTHGELIARMRHNVSMPLVNGDNAQNVAVDMVFVADNFFKFMDVDIVEGRDFQPSDHKAKDGVYIFNETARQKFGITLEHRFLSASDMVMCEIVGFCKDFKFKPLQYEVSPLVFFIPGQNTPDYATLVHLYIRIADGADVKKTMDFIEDALAKVDPEFPSIGNPVKTFQNEVLSSNYTQETNLTQMVTLFAVIAILISVMGIFGIVYFETERRRKEIGIRRVNGATIMEILSMFNVKFLKITAVCSAVAIPIAYLLVQKYFSGFAYHYAINVWIFILSVLIAMAVTALVVTAASFKAANENPVKTLKNE